MDCYNTFQDYFGLSNIAWQLDDLEKLVPQQNCSGEDTCSNELCLNLIEGFSSFDPLEIIRNDAHEDFQQNGVDVDLDDLDKYQAQLRERTSFEQSESDCNPVLNEYLALKRNKNKKAKKVCVFCKNNGERPDVFMSHVLKDGDGRVVCPVLRKYTCPLCGVSGDNAHTIRYCPKNDGNFSSIALLKTTRIATGKRRKDVNKHWTENTFNTSSLYCSGGVFDDNSDIFSISSLKTLVRIVSPRRFKQSPKFKVFYRSLHDNFRIAYHLWLNMYFGYSLESPRGGDKNRIIDAKKWRKTIPELSPNTRSFNKSSTMCFEQRVFFFSFSWSLIILDFRLLELKSYLVYELIL